MNQLEFENFLEVLFCDCLGDPDRASGLLAEVDSDFRNAYVEDNDDETLLGMHNALDDLRAWLDRVETALRRCERDLNDGLFDLEGGDHETA